MSEWACVRVEGVRDGVSGGGKRRRVGSENTFKGNCRHCYIVAIAMAIHFDACTFPFTAHFHFIVFPPTPTPTHTFIYSDLSNYSAVSYRACHFGYWLIKKQQNSGLDGIISNCCCCYCCHCFCFCCFNCCLLLAKIHGKKSRSNSQKEKTKKAKKQRRAEKTWQSRVDFHFVFSKWPNKFALIMTPSHERFVCGQLE